MLCTNMCISLGIPSQEVLLYSSCCITRPSSLDIPAGSLTHTNMLAHILSCKKLDSGPDQCLIRPDIRLLRIPNGTNTKLKTLSYGKLEKNIPIIFVFSFYASGLLVSEGNNFSEL